MSFDRVTCLSQWTAQFNHFGYLVAVQHMGKHSHLIQFATDENFSVVWNVFTLKPKTVIFRPRPDEAHLHFKPVVKTPAEPFDVYMKMDFKDYTVFLSILQAQLSSRTWLYLWLPTSIVTAVSPKAFVEFNNCLLLNRIIVQRVRSTRETTGHNTRK